MSSEREHKQSVVDLFAELDDLRDMPDSATVPFHVTLGDLRNLRALAAEPPAAPGGRLIVTEQQLADGWAEFDKCGEVMWHIYANAVRLPDGNYEVDAPNPAAPGPDVRALREALADCAVTLEGIDRGCTWEIADGVRQVIRESITKARAALWAGKERGA